MNKAIRDAIEYARGKSEEANSAAMSGAIATARVHSENGLTVLRAAALMNDLNAPAQQTFRDIRNRLKANV